MTIKMIVDFQFFRKILKSFNAIDPVDGMFVVMNPRGIGISQMDDGHTYACYGFVPKESFKNWEVDGNDLVNVRLPDVEKVFRKLKGSLASIEVGDKMKVSVGRSSMEVPLVDASYSEDKKATPFQIKGELVRAKVPVGDFRNGLDICETSGEMEVCISSVDGKLVLFSSSGLNMRAHLVEILDLEGKGKCYYLMKTLLNIVEAGSVFSDVVSLKFSYGYPMELDFQLPFKGSLKYGIAPFMAVGE